MNKTNRRKIMKKILAMAVVVVMMFTVCAATLTAEAASDHINIDVTAATGSSVELTVADGKVVAKTNGGDPWVSIPLSEVDTSVYTYFTILYRADKEIGSNNTYLMDTSVNPGYSPAQGTWAPHGMAGTGDGELHTKQYSIEDFPAMVGTKLTGVRFTACGDIDGQFTIEGLVFSSVPYDQISDDEPAAPAATLSLKNFVGEGESIGVWVNEGNPSTTVKFTTAGEFNSVNFHYWASCVETTTGPEAEWDVELYKFAYNTENTLSKKPVASKSVHSIGDNRPETTLTFDTQKAGTYIVKFTLTNPTFEQDFGGTVKKPYLVLPKITNPDPDKFAFSGEAFNMGVNGADVEGDFYLANPAETDVPADNPGTADASVIAIAAVACVALAGVVVAKKVR